MVVLFWQETRLNSLTFHFFFFLSIRFKATWMHMYVWKRFQHLNQENHKKKYLTFKILRKVERFHAHWEKKSSLLLSNLIWYIWCVTLLFYVRMGPKKNFGKIFCTPDVLYFSLTNKNVTEKYNIRRILQNLGFFFIALFNKVHFFWLKMLN